MANKYGWITREILEQDYDELGSFKLIAEKYDIWPSIVIYYCKKFGVKTVPKLSYTCNDGFFSKDTEESFYVAGFIAADGCILQHKSDEPNCLNISLSKKDEDHLIKLKKTLGFTGPIKYNTSKHSLINKNWNDVITARFSIYSKQMIKDLEKFDIGQRKSLTYKMPEWLTEHPLVRHFIRGYVDGDGSFYFGSSRSFSKKINEYKEYKKYNFSTRGTEQFLLQMKYIIDNNMDFSSKALPKFNNGIYQLCYSGTPLVAKIVQYLYRDATIFMSRKYEFVKDLVHDLYSKRGKIQTHRVSITITDEINNLLNEAVTKYSIGNKAITARRALEIGLKNILSVGE